MFPQFVVLASLTSVYDQKLSSLTKNSRLDQSQMQPLRKQILELDMDENYVDSTLTASSLAQVQKLRQDIFKYEKYDTVVVAPLQKSLKTCYEIFKTQSQKDTQNNQGKPQRNIDFYIQPLLCDKLNSTHSIGDISQIKNKEDYAKFDGFYEDFSQKVNKSQWLYDLLPQRIIKELPKNAGLKSGAQYVKLLKSTDNRKNIHEQHCLQTQVEFSQRIQKLKDSLLEYQRIKGSGRKVLVIASAQVLNHLAATDFYENGQPVNPLRLSHGEHDLVNLVVNGFDTISQLESQSILPFCR